MNDPQPINEIPLAALENTSKSYQLGDGQMIEILSQINLGIRKGDFIALLGQSGSGKSTILRILSGLVRPTSGTVYRHGDRLRDINEGFSIVFQSFALYPWLTVYENVQVGLTKRKLSEDAEHDEISKALELIGLTGHENAYPKELSGGMRQRVGFARALVARPEILAMDEPFSALDVLTAKNLRAEIVDLWARGNAGFEAAFMVTHNIAEAVSMASKIMVLSSRPGRIIHTIENPLPYPRDEKSAQFKDIVEEIHDLITALDLPESPRRPSIPPIFVQQKERFESLPPVEVNRIMGLLEILDSDHGRADLFDIASQLREEFGSVISTTKAAEILGFVTTPEHQIILTPVGKRFIDAGAGPRTEFFRKQVLALGLFQWITKTIDAEGAVEEARLKEMIATQLPYENADRTADTVIDWGRYAKIFAFDDKGKVFEPIQEEDE